MLVIPSGALPEPERKHKSTWQRHTAKDCRHDCWYCTHPPVGPTSKHVKVAQSKLKALRSKRVLNQIIMTQRQMIAQLEQKLTQQEDRGQLVKPVTNPATIESVRRSVTA